MQTRFESMQHTLHRDQPTTLPRYEVSQSIFSYVVKNEFSAVTLTQKETGFFLVLEMEKLEETLRVTRFMLVADNPRLKAASQNLHDAAEIEIVLQALIGVFSYAEYHKMSEILFILPQDEAIQISCFEGLFEEVASVTLGEEKRVSLRLSCVFQDYFLEQVVDIKTKIHRELWVRQREDLVLKCYFQNRHKKDFSFLQRTLFTPELTAGAKIIAFPK